MFSEYSMSNLTFATSFDLATCYDFSHVGNPVIYIYISICVAALWQYKDQNLSNEGMI